MRLFIAVTLPDDIKEYIKDIQKQIPSDNNKIKLIPAEQLHLTLKFLGEVSEEKVDKIKSSLSIVKVKHFKAALDGTGAFPSENYIRVVWVGLKPKNGFIELQQNIDKSLLELFRPDKRFHPHVTIARVRFVEDKKNFFEKVKKIKVEEKEFTVKSFKLVKSTLTGEGPVYEEIGSF
jgi:2'-5' RNA ligase